MTIKLARTFQTGAASYDIVEHRHGAMLEYWIEQTDFNKDNELELIFEQRGAASFIVKNEGGRVAAVTAGGKGWEMVVGPICTRHEQIADFGDRLGAIEAAARILLP